ncbi:hypothetical protein POV27_14230 [Aureisphaera galaxeae]|uniref:hypothetical protein n=1 Tax=Aureisphaera galaxeae TaxID=1538023 RepID=UPI002350E09E|nr:hypothetical protein [Aureisphaera galaxeae]MDC8005215.1 hypothetical protein [Aureisphaera galaxeae]
MKKIKAATIVEILAASAIIVTVFTIASLSLNNVFKGVVKGNDSEFQNRLKELTYLTKHQKIAVPYYEDNEQWDIAIEKQEGVFILEAVHKPSKKETQRLIHETIR